MSNVTSSYTDDWRLCKMGSVDLLLMRNSVQLNETSFILVKDETISSEIMNGGAKVVSILLLRQNLVL